MLKTELAAPILAAGSALAVAPSVHAATDYFMRIDPRPGNTQIPGESQDVSFPGNLGYIAIKSFSHDVENVMTIASQTSGAGAVKAKFNELEIEKDLDSTSPQIFQALAQGQHFKASRSSRPSRVRRRRRRSRAAPTSRWPSRPPSSTAPARVTTPPRRS